MRVSELHSPAMGSRADVLVVGGPLGLAQLAGDRIADLEARWSRFRPDSEVSRHNADLAAGRVPAPPSDDTRLLFERAAEGHLITGGAFDPYRLDAVCAAGYTAPLGLHGTPTATPGAGPAPRTGFDPGGIGKGLAADLVTRELIEAGADGALVSIGGDLRVIGESPDGGPWRIDVEDPLGDAPLGVVELLDGGVATSSRLKRRWTTADGDERHHLIDTSTGRPMEGGPIAVTVVAAHAWQAEVVAKAVFRDQLDGVLLVESLDAAALVVTPDLVSTTARWATVDAGAREAGR